AETARVRVRCVDDDLRLERRGSAVEISQALAVEVALEDRKIAADGLAVEERRCVGHDVAAGMPGACRLALLSFGRLDLGILVERIGGVARLPQDGRVALLFEAQGQVLAARGDDVSV